jgi:HEAT repeat protein
VEGAKKGNRAKLGQITESGNALFAEELLPDMIVLLKEKDAQIQLVAVQGLYVIRNPKSKDALVAYLQGKDYAKLEKSLIKGELDRNQYLWEIQSAVCAILTLGEVGDKSVIPLLESLRSVKELRHFEGMGAPVEVALAKLGIDGIESIRKVGPNEDGNEITRAAQAISQIRNASQLPSLVATVQDDTTAEAIRGSAVTAIAEIQGSNALPFVLSVMREKKYPAQVRAQAVVEASKLGSAETEMAIQELLEDPGCGIRPECLYYLAKMSPQRHLRRAVEFMLDKTQTPMEREKLSNCFWVRGFDANAIKQNREMLLECVKAAREDGTPADDIRVKLWIVLNRATGEEPVVELGVRNSDAVSLLRNHMESVYRMRYRQESLQQTKVRAAEVFASKVKFVESQEEAITQ